MEIATQSSSILLPKSNVEGAILKNSTSKGESLVDRPRIKDASSFQILFRELQAKWISSCSKLLEIVFLLPKTLCCQVSIPNGDEIHAAVFGLKKSIAPGPDEFSGVFFLQLLGYFGLFSC